VIYKALLRHLDYVTDLDLAELEIALEVDGRLAEFERRYEAQYRQSWRSRRGLIALAMNEASAIMHALEPSTYPAADTWARTRRATDVTPNLLAERTLELTRRRLGDRTVLFVVDEVGQYVSRSTDKMLDLQGVVQAFGRAGKGKVWLAVTSQERLDEVVDSLEGKAVELARVQDRFPLRVDLAPSDISEVTSKRVLTKKPEWEERLAAAYERFRPTLTNHSRLAASSRRIALDAHAFVEMYPFLPYQIDLTIDIVSGLRNQPGASRQTGGANRTIIKLAQQVLINPHVNLGARPVGELVTLDMLYDLVEGNVGFERRHDINEIVDQYAETPLVAKVAKAICLLQFVRGVSRTPENLAAVLYPALGSEALIQPVQEALQTLLAGQRIREGENGYELLSVQGKTWEEERRSIAPKPADMGRLKKELAAELLKELRPYRYKNVRNFAPAVSIDGEAPSKGEIPLQVRLEDDDPGLLVAYTVAQDSSRQAKGTAFWVVPVSAAVFLGLQELYRSRQMIDRHERRIASAEEGVLLSDEKNRQGKLLQTLRNDLSAAFLAGRLYFAGREQRAQALGGAVGAVASALFADVVPRLYDRVDLGAVAVKGDEVRPLLTNTNLVGLPAVLYDGAGGLGLVHSAQGSYRLNPNAAIVQEVSGFIAGGNTGEESKTGKLLESHFGAPPYGWDADVVLLVVAALFRAGAIEVTSQGRTTRAWTDPVAQSVFLAMPRFRAAEFRPREEKTPTLAEMISAMKGLRDLYAEEPALEVAAIANTVRTRLREEVPGLAGLAERLRAHGLPGWEEIDALRRDLEGLGTSTDDDAVKSFARQHEAIGAGLARARTLETATTEANLATIAQARQAVNEFWPLLRGRSDVTGALEDAAARLCADLTADTWESRLTQVATDAGAIVAAYRRLREAVKVRHEEAFARALSELDGQPDYAGLPLEARERVAAPLRERLVRAAGGDGAYGDLTTLESDLRLLPSLTGDALVAIEHLLAPEVRVERVRVGRFVGGAIGTQDELEAQLGALRDYCAKLLAEGARVVLE